MTNRQLEGEERELTEKNLKNRKQDLQKLNNNLEYNKDLINKQIYLREFDDKWREFLRELKDYEDSQIVKTIEAEIKLTQDIIKTTEKQLKEGVNNKHNPIVN